MAASAGMGLGGADVTAAVEPGGVAAAGEGGDGEAAGGAGELSTVVGGDGDWEGDGIGASAI